MNRANFVVGGFFTMISCFESKGVLFVLRRFVGDSLFT